MRALPATFLVGIFATVLAAPVVGQARVTSTPPPGQGQAGAKQWRMDYYPVQVEDWHSELTVQLSQLTGVEADLYLKRGSQPTLSDYDYKSAKPFTANELIVIDSGSSPAIKVWSKPPTSVSTLRRIKASPPQNAVSPGG